MKRATSISILCLVAVAAAMALLPVEARASNPNDILIIANNNVGVDSVSLDEVRSYFLRQRTSWRGGGRVNPVNAAPGSALRQAFQQRVLGMSAAEETTYWQDQRIRHGTDSPNELGNTLQAVFRIQGGVSYVFRSQFREGVAKVLLVIPA